MTENPEAPNSEVQLNSNELLNLPDVCLNVILEKCSLSEIFCFSRTCRHAFAIVQRNKTQLGVGFRLAVLCEDRLYFNRLNRWSLERIECAKIGSFFSNLQVKTFSMEFSPQAKNDARYLVTNRLGKLTFEFNFSHYLKEQYSAFMEIARTWRVGALKVKLNPQGAPKQLHRSIFSIVRDINFKELTFLLPSQRAIQSVPILKLKSFPERKHLIPMSFKLEKDTPRQPRSASFQFTWKGREFDRLLEAMHNEQIFLLSNESFKVLIDIKPVDEGQKVSFNKALELHRNDFGCFCHEKINVI